MQLLALLIELVSIKVAGKGIKKPIDIDRPGKKKKGQVRHPDDTGAQHPLRRPASPPSQVAAEGKDAAFKAGIDVLRKSARPR